MRDDIACRPEEFVPWDDVRIGTRSAAAVGSTIQAWIFVPDNRCVFDVAVIEAETYEGASPELLEEVQAVIESVDHGG